MKRSLTRQLPTIIMLLLLLYFWLNGLTGLDRFPKIHEDESWQAAPGYTFWAEGRFGTDLFAGFYGMERHYYGFMPLFPIMVGGALHLFGLGLFQARLVPLILTTLTLALTYRLGRQLYSPWHGVVAVAILTGWRIAGPFAHLQSGIPLADVARIVRYDSAVPLFALLALLVFHRAVCLGPTQSVGTKTSLLIGLLVGLATLSHLYGAFWLPALILSLIWLTRWRSIKPALVISLGFGLALLPWLVFVASGWPDFLGQSRNYANRFGLLDYRFFLTNLLQEVERYDPLLNGAEQSLGSWLWLIACLLSLGWLINRAISGTPAAWSPGWLTDMPPDREKLSAQLLLTVLGTMGGLFALLLSFKTFSYLATLWPILALVIAAGIGYVWRMSPAPAWWRPALAGLFVLAMLEGAVVSTTVRHRAGQTTSYRAYTQAIAAKLPPNQQVMGLQHYWLGLVEASAGYRSILVPIFWTSPQYVPQPHSFAQAVNTIPPDIVLLDQVMLDFMAESDNPDHELHDLNQQIVKYLSPARATLIGQVDDPTYGRTRIYQLTPNVSDTSSVESDTR